MHASSPPPDLSAFPRPFEALEASGRRTDVDELAVHHGDPNDAREIDERRVGGGRNARAGAVPEPMRQCQSNLDATPPKSAPISADIEQGYRFRPCNATLRTQRR